MLSVLPLLVVLLAPSRQPDGRLRRRRARASASRSPGTGLWSEARFRFERAVALDPENADALNNLGVALEQQGEFAKAREAYEKALKLKPGNLYIQQNYDLFREADDKRNRKKKPTHDDADSGPDPAPTPSLALAALLAGAAAPRFVEVPVETPLQSKIDVTALPARAGGGLRHRPGRERRGPRLRDLAPAAEPAPLQHRAAGAGARPPAPARRAREGAREAGRGRQVHQAGEGAVQAGGGPRARRTPSTGARWARSSRTR